LGRSPASLAGDQLKPILLGTNDERLNDTVGAYRLGQFIQLGLIEYPARLERARIY
jgi:hypothetical protein